MQNYLAITGIGLICPLGAGARNVFECLCNGADAFGPLTRFDTEKYAIKRGGQLSEDLEMSLRDEYPDYDLGLAMLLRSAREALATTSSTGRLALVLGTNFGMMETQEWAWRERLDTGTLDSETYSQCDTCLDILKQELNAVSATQLSMSCASGTATLRTAADILQQNRADKVLCLAYDTLTEYCWCGLSNLHTISADTVRPFDAKRSGTVFCEGAAALLLESSPGAPPIAWLAGCATNNNAFHITAPPKEAEGSRLVMASALADANLKPEDIDHICAHATGTKGNDSTESAALNNLFGDKLADIPVAAHKSQLGHMLGAAGLAEAIVTILSMRGDKIPPTVNHTDFDTETCIKLNCLPGLKAVPCHTSQAITNAAGLGGNNAAAVLTIAPGHGNASQIPSKLYIRQLAWILPESQSSGPDLLNNPQWLQWTDNKNKLLSAFNPKFYLHSVKGYLDTASAFQLAAFALCFGQSPVLEHPERLGITTITRYGAQQSAFGFFRQMQEKGPRLASPLIFPHGYASTAGNLSAIEFGISGPHQIFYGNEDVREPLFFAFARLGDGTTDEIAVGAQEAAPDIAIPDGRQLLHGAIALRLAATPKDGDLGTIDLADLKNTAPFFPVQGSVSALGSLLTAIIKK